MTGRRDERLGDERRRDERRRVGAGKLFVGAIVWTLAIAILAFTFLPMIDTNVWWIRAMAFPRLQIAVAGAAALCVALLLPGPTRVAVPVLMVVAIGYQLWRIAPYTPVVDHEMALAPRGPDEIRVLSSNVLMENDRHDLMLEVVESFDPDVLLLMETDQAWIDAMEPALGRYSTVVREPRSDHYGMLFATRLDVDEARTIRLTTSETPSLFAQMKGPGGTPFRFVGLHPRPPMPGQSTQERDAQIYYAARFAAKAGMPLIATGDFNDVAWSDTSQTFKLVGEYLDPRIGRGFFASFDAERPFMRYPIDQFYATADVAVVAIERLPYVGSDHFPMAATIRLDAALAAELNTPPPPISEAERELVERSVERTRRLLQHAEP